MFNWFTKNTRTNKANNFNTQKKRIQDDIKMKRCLGVKRQRMNQYSGHNDAEKQGEEAFNKCMSEVITNNNPSYGSLKKNINMLSTSTNTSKLYRNILTDNQKKNNRAIIQKVIENKALKKERQDNMFRKQENTRGLSFENYQKRLNSMKTGGRFIKNGRRYTKKRKYH
jgi:hypothetical protein